MTPMENTSNMQIKNQPAQRNHPSKQEEIDTFCSKCDQLVTEMKPSKKMEKMSSLPLIGAVVRFITSFQNVSHVQAAAEKFVVLQKIITLQPENQKLLQVSNQLKSILEEAKWGRKTAEALEYWMNKGTRSVTEENPLTQESGYLDYVDQHGQDGAITHLEKSALSLLDADKWTQKAEITKKEIADNPSSSKRNELEKSILKDQVNVAQAELRAAELGPDPTKVKPAQIKLAQARVDFYDKVTNDKQAEITSLEAKRFKIHTIIGQSGSNSTNSEFAAKLSDNIKFAKFQLLEPSGKSLLAKAHLTFTKLGNESNYQEDLKAIRNLTPVVKQELELLAQSQPKGQLEEAQKERAQGMLILAKLHQATSGASQ